MRINSSFSERGQMVTEVIGVVGVVVKLTMAAFAGVGFVTADVIWIGFIKVSFAMLSIHAAFYTVPCCA